jgi:hypothetical protein
MSQLIKGGFTKSAGTAGGSSSPPQVSGTLSEAQAAAADRVVTAFWSALGRNNAAAVAGTVPPAQRSYVRSLLTSNGPKITVTSFRIVSAQPAGNGVPQSPGGGQWLVTTRTDGHWYVNLDRSTALVFAGACP